MSYASNLRRHSIMTSEGSSGQLRSFANLCAFFFASPGGASAQGTNAVPDSEIAF